MSGNGFTCVETTELGEGPFYYETSPRRSAIAEGRPGEPMRLSIVLGGVPAPGIETNGQCVPLAGAVVDIWHSDAAGLYSNVSADIQYADTVGMTFLRGHQFTDENGRVEFETIVPGWELVAAAAPVVVAKRTTHIHVKVYHGRNVMTTQLFMPDPLLDRLYTEVEPYKSHRELPAPGVEGTFARIRNGEDGMFVASHAKPLDVERVAGVLTARATLGMISLPGTSAPPLWR